MSFHRSSRQSDRHPEQAVVLRPQAATAAARQSGATVLSPDSPPSQKNTVQRGIFIGQPLALRNAQ